MRLCDRCEVCGEIVCLCMPCLTQAISDGKRQRVESLAGGHKEKHGAIACADAGIINDRGMVGQMVVSRWLAAPYVCTVGFYHSLPDVDYRGFPIEVKTEYPSLMARADDLEHFRLDQVFVQVVPVGSLVDLNTHRKWRVNGFSHLGDMVKFPKQDLNNGLENVWLATVSGCFKGQQVCKLIPAAVLKVMLNALRR